MGDIRDIVLEVVQAVLPIAVLVVVLIMLFVPHWWPVVLQFLIGTLMVVTGLGLFLLGVKVGLLPLGQAIGSELPQWGSLPLILFFIFVLGVAVTVAEPDVRVLAAKVDTVSSGEIARGMLITLVAVGVGLFMAVAAARMVLGIPLSYILIGGYLAVFVLSYYVPSHYVPISFDAGGVTTGPMTVPFILALGVGFAAVLGGKGSLSDSFGWVALASIGPVLAVLLLGVIYG
ncbi:MAG: DUF1538 domain-containing protein [Candidatus Desulforudis sp.]|nr:DUF1538 domain-containing protein [Desulforudis sp.]